MIKYKKYACLGLLVFLGLHCNIITQEITASQFWTSDDSPLTMRRLDAANTLSNSIDIHTHIPDVGTVDRTKGVGEIPYSTSISPTGAMTVSVPLDIYQDPQGFAPQIGLAYNSQGGNGDLGQGWSVYGLSAITPINRSIYYDSETAGIELSNSDAFALDGIRLIKVKSTTNGYNFRTEQGHIEVEGYFKDGAMYYAEVKYPNGNTGIFGSKSITEKRTSCPLTKLKDLWGHEVNFTYEYAGGHYKIKEITYGASQKMSVKFTHVLNSSRKDRINTYMAGKAMTYSTQLQTIETFFNGNLLKTYSLYYKTQGLVSVISEIGCKSGDTSLNPIVFYYGPEKPFLYTFQTEETQLTQYYSFKDRNEIRLVIGQFEYGSDSNGLISLPNKNPYLERYDKSGIGNHSKRLIESQYKSSDKIVIHTELANSMSGYEFTINTEDGFRDIFCMDVDGFDEEEIVKVNNTVSGEYDVIDFHVYASSSLGGVKKKYTRTFKHPTVLDHYGDKSITPKFYFTGDFRGNGKMQVLAISGYNTIGKENVSRTFLFDLDNNQKLYDGSSITYNVCYERTGTQGAISAEDAEKQSDKLFVMDYDGDGKSDICLINDAGTHVYTFTGTGSTYTLKKVATYSTLTRKYFETRQLLLGDFNGDGKTDIMVSPQVGSNYWELHTSNGTGSFVKSTLTLGSRLVNTDLMTCDINRDGCTDILVRTISSGGSTMNIYYIADGVLQTTARTSLSGDFALASANVSDKKKSYSQLIAIKDNKATKIYSDNNAMEQRMLTGIVSSLGTVNKIAYQQLNEESNDKIYYRGYGAEYPYRNYNGPLMVVARTNSFIGGIKTEDTRYNYENAVIHTEGLGFQGFQGLQSGNSINNEVVISTYDPYNYSVLKEVDTNTSTVTYVTTATANSDKFLTIYPRSKKVKDKLNNVTTTYTYSQDMYGNRTYEKIEYSTPSDAYQTTNITYKNVNDGTHYIVGLPVSQKTTYQGGTTVVKSITTEYNSVYLPVSKTYTGSEISQEKFVYNAKWQLTESSYKNVKFKNWFSTKYEYDTYGRVSKETDTYGIARKFAYDTFGRLKTATDALNSVTSYEYDDWNLVKTIYPDATVSLTDYTWSDVSSKRTLFYVTQDSPGSRKTKTYYDAAGREVRNAFKLIDGSYSVTDIYYDAIGRISKVSEPYLSSSSATLWNTYDYDMYNRLTKLKYASDKEDRYSYGTRTITEIKDGVETTKRFTGHGRLSQVDDPGGTIKYTYRADGSISTMSAAGEYVDYAYEASTNLVKQEKRRSKGTTTYSYSESANTQTVSRNGEEIVYTYDSKNRLSKIQEKGSSSLTTTYTYDTYSRPSTVATGTNTSKVTYTYDNLGRISTETESLDNGAVSLKKTYGYSNGKVQTIKYTGKAGDIATVTYKYTNEVPTSLTVGSTIIWKLNNENALSLPTNVTTGMLTRTYAYDSYGYPTERKVTNGTTTNFHETYKFDFKTGNLKERINPKHNRAEGFGYDSLNRLTKYATVAGTTAPTPVSIITYADNGNILTKNDAGSYEYSSTKLTAYTPSSSTAVAKQEVSYTAYLGDRHDEITTGTSKTKYYYKNGGVRIRTTRYSGSTVIEDKYYIGGQYEYDVKNDRQILYLGGSAYTSSVAYIKDSREGTSNWTFRYICRDYQGNVVYTTNPTGSYTESVSYDPWGRMRSTSTHGVYPVGNEMPMRLGRSYGSHEQLSSHGLINMNARLYNPVLGRFISPDPYIQNPYFSQNYNPYAYAFNNPMKYNDPSGEFLHLIIGSAVGGVANWATHGFKFNAKGLGYFATGAVAGAIGAGIGTGVSSLIGGGGFGAGFIGSSSAVAATSSFVSGAAIGGASGFASGYLTGLGNSLVNGRPFGKALGDAGLTGLQGGVTGGLFGGVIGGIDALAHGREFWDGATVVKETVVEQSIPIVGQEGDLDCLIASAKAVDESFGGTMSQEQIRNLDGIIEGPNGGFMDRSVWEAYAKETGRRWGGQFNRHATLGQMLDEMKKDARMAINLDMSGQDMGHSVVMQKVVRKTITKANGKIINKMMYYVMDPGNGGKIRQISDRSILNAKNIFYIYP